MKYWTVLAGPRKTLAVFSPLARVKYRLSITHLNFLYTFKVGASISYGSRERDTRDNTRPEPKRDIFKQNDDRGPSPFRKPSDTRRDFSNRDDARGQPLRRQETTETVSKFINNVVLTYIPRNCNSIVS